ncbi:MAG: peptidylprolyl isomerase [Pseudomonadota bacterium]
MTKVRSAQVFCGSWSRVFGCFAASMVICLLLVPGGRAQTVSAVAVVNEDIISIWDVEQRLSLVIASTGGVSNEAQLNRLREQVVRSLVDDKLKLQEAAEYDIVVPDRAVQESFARLAANFNQTPEQFEGFLEQNGTSKTALLDQIRAEITWGQLVDARFGQFALIGEEDVNQILNRLEQARGEFEFDVAEIYLSTSPDRELETRASAQRIVDQLRQGASFAGYARQFSNSVTAAIGGDLGWVIASQINPTLAEVVKRTTVGGITDPIRTPGGYYILQVKDRRRVLSADPLDVQLTLRQVFWELPPEISTEQRRQVARRAEAVQSRISGCDGLDSIAEATGATSGDIGTLRLREMPEQLHEQLIDVNVGQSSPPVIFPSGIRLLVVCDRQEPQVQAPSPDSVRDQLSRQKMSMMSRRYLRDLRRDAIVDMR